MARENWLDIGLAMITRGDEIADERRWRRVHRLAKDASSEDWNTLSAFARAVWVWAAVSDEARQYLPENMRARLAAANEMPDPSPELAAVMANQFLLQSGARLKAQHDGGSITIVTDDYGLHGVTTCQWQAWLFNPRQISECETCGAPFTARAGAKYCSRGCGSGAARQAA